MPRASPAFRLPIFTKQKFKC
uniref:Uncharacterized protein n=1 Tax=Anguilla anguilla TaxID=7936 RepID=A0A0E9R0R7_ANGAN